MKKNDYKQLIRLLFISTFLLFSAISCNDNNNNDDDLGPLYGYAFAENAVAQKVNMDLELDKPEEIKFSFNLRRKTAKEIQISYKYDASLVDFINKKHNKEYKLFPEDLFNLSKEMVKILPEESISDSVTLSIQSINLQLLKDAGLEENAEYLIPIKAAVSEGDFIIPEKDSYLVFIVKAPSSKIEKSTGIKIFSCMEINKENPLNHLNYKLKKSDKYLFDVVILFSLNLHYNHATKKVQVSLNRKNKFLLDNIEKYVRPLQKAGMKVIFGLTPHGSLNGLPNPAGIGNLTDDACRNFALELKRFTDYYELDGMFLDDEYGYNMGYGYDKAVLLPHFNVNASSRLAYEIKKVMPNKMLAVYTYSYLSRMVKVENKVPGDFVDYILPDYGDSYDYTQDFEGLTKERAGIYSQDFGSDLYDFLEEDFATLRREGFKANMVYGLKPGNSHHNKTLEILTRVLFDDELIIEGEIHKSEWAHVSDDGHKNWSDE